MALHVLGRGRGHAVRVRSGVVLIAPNLASLNVSTGPGRGGTAVTLTGTGFTGTTSVTFGGVAATSVVVVNSTTITCVTGFKSVDFANSLLVNVVVTNPISSSTLTNGFNYTNATFTLTSVTPSSGPIAGGTALTIVGTDFSVIYGLDFQKTSSTAPGFVLVNSTTITCNSPASPDGAIGAANLRVTGPDGTKQITFTYT